MGRSDRGRVTRRRTGTRGTAPHGWRLTRAGRPPRDSIGLGNVDARLRQVYGDEFGLVVETAQGAGTKVSFRVPKFAPGIHAAS